MQMRAAGHYSRWLWLILLVGLLLRLGYALDQPTLNAPRYEGGDSNWYLSVGWGFFSGQEHGKIRGITFYNSVIPTPPLYILFAGIIQQALPAHETIIAIRLIQCLAAAATVYLVFRLATLISGDRRAGILGAAIASIHPALVIEPANIASETLYIFFLALGFWLYLEYFAAAAGWEFSNRLGPSLALALTALAFGLATLTRAVSLLFPVGIVLHMKLLQHRGYIRGWRRSGFVLLAVYIAIAATWTIHNAVLWNRFVIVSDQFMPALWRAAETEDGSPQQNDALLLEGADAVTLDDCEVDCKYQHGTEIYAQQIGSLFGADPGGYFLRQINELLYSLVQPHGTTSLGDVSIREAAQTWLTKDRSFDGLLYVLQIEGFVVKLAFWIFHLGGIALGLLGMLWSRARRPLSLPLIGFVLYTIIAHFFLLALPRYLFPLEIIWLTFGGIAAAELIDRWQAKHVKASLRS